MSETAVICGNWGGSSLRAFRLDRSGRLVGDVREAAGINALSKPDQERVWFETVSDWVAPSVQHLICGSAGSNLGWLETGYVDCPARVEHIVAGIDWREIGGHSIGIVPGVSGQNALGEPDRMRSEETEIVGWIAAQNDAHPSGRLCLPGTHTKWATVDAGQIVSFSTALTGEAFAALNTGTVVTRGAGGVQLGDAFDQGVALGMRDGAGDLLHRLFSVRARQLSGVLAAEHSASFLSGLLIGCDIRGAKGAAGFDDGPVTIIAGPRLTDAYARAMAQCGQAFAVLDSQTASEIGFAKLVGIGS